MSGFAFIAVEAGALPGDLASPVLDAPVHFGFDTGRILDTVRSVSAGSGADTFLFLGASVAEAGPSPVFVADAHAARLGLSVAQADAFGGLAAGVSADLDYFIIHSPATSGSDPFHHADGLSGDHIIDVLPGAATHVEHIGSILAGPAADSFHFL